MRQIIIIGGGSSAKELDFKKLNNKFTFGLNHVCHFFDPTALIWIDTDFYNLNKQFIDDKTCIKITKHDCDVPENILKLNASKTYFGENGLQQGLYSPYLVGLFSLSLAIALKFEEIFLLGYDCGFVDNKSHFHDIEHRGRLNERPYTKIQKFNVYKDCTNRIYNVSMASRLQIFPKISYSDFYDKITNNVVDQTSGRQWLIDNLRKSS